jgi:integrase
MATRQCFGACHASSGAQTGPLPAAPAASTTEKPLARQRRAGGGVDRLPSGRYRVRIVTPDGRRISLGTRPTKRAAEAAYARAITDHADGKTVGVHAKGLTLGEYAPRWLDARLTSRGEPLRQRTRELYENQLELHILPTFDNVALTRITTASVRAWSAQMRGDSGPGVSTAAKCYRLLRTIMGTAAEDGLVIANPCTIRGAGIEPASERPIITVAQAFALADLVGARLRCVVLIAAFVGLRKGEILGLRRRDLDLDAGVVCIDQQRQLSRNGTHLVGPPKTDAGRRTVSIPASLLNDLRGHVEHFAQPDDDGYVFTGVKGGPLAPHVLQKAWAEARAEGGLDHVHLHDLRHLAGTLAAGTGAGTKELMHRLGHSSHQAALRYQHATADRDLRIAELIDGKLVDASGAAPHESIPSTSGLRRKHIGDS